MDGFAAVCSNLAVVVLPFGGSALV